MKNKCLVDVDELIDLLEEAETEIIHTNNIRNADVRFGFENAVTRMIIHLQQLKLEHINKEFLQGKDTEVNLNEQ